MNEDEEKKIGFLKDCSEVYYNSGDLLISDAEFDALYLEYSREFPDNPFFQKIGAPVRGSKIKHTNQIAGLEQVHDGELSKWLIRTDHKEEHLVASEKLDGTSLTLRYNGQLKSGYTRGDGIYGADVTRHVLKIPSVPKAIQGECEVRGEFIIKKENFEIVKEILLKVSGKEYTNLRGIINGLVNSKEIPDEVFPYLDFIAYSTSLPLSKRITFKWLEEQKFLVPKFLTIHHGSLTEPTLNNILENFRTYSSYEIDGIVVDYNEVEKRAALGVHESTCNPKFAFKWKTRAEDNIAQAICIGVEWNISKHLYWKPVVLIEPVDLCGITVGRLSGFNARFIKDNMVGAGATLTITRAGDVIPYIMSVDSPADEWDQPKGDWHWNETEVDAVSAYKTEDSHLLQVKHFFNTLEIDNVQEATLRTLIDNDNTSIPSIIYMTKEEWSKLIGKNGEKAHESLHTKLQNVYLWELLAAWPYFGRGFGKRKAKTLVEAYGLRVLGLSHEEIIAVDGFSDKSAKVYLKGLDSFNEFFDWLTENQYTALKKDDIIDSSTGKLSNQNFVFTGFRDKEANLRIEELGGSVQDGIKKDTTYLVMKDSSKVTNKTKAAEAQGVKIISIEELMEMLK